MNLDFLSEQSVPIEYVKSNLYVMGLASRLFTIL